MKEFDALDPELWEVINTGEEVRKLIYKGSVNSPLKPGRPRSNEEYGLTQGSPLSPILAIIALDSWKALRRSTGKRLLYADDGLFFDNVDELEAAPELKAQSFDLGVEFNLKKSGRVKKRNN